MSRHVSTCIASRCGAGAGARLIRLCGAKCASRRVGCVTPTMTLCSTCKGWRRAPGWRDGPARRSLASIRQRHAKVSRPTFINAASKYRATCTPLSVAGGSAPPRSAMRSLARRALASRLTLNRDRAIAADGRVACQRKPSKQAMARRTLDCGGTLAGAPGIASVLFCGSTEERSRSELLAARMQRAEVSPPATLVTIASALATASIVIGLDTGLTHLAAALGRPTVGIFAITTRRWWG